MIKVRVQNFQSIKDATLIVDGLTVLTGPNNSGKTAFLRAVRGVFTNPPPGPLVRHGEAYLSVSITFDDGSSVVWEKGWEKPGQKGKTINRYILNGKLLDGVSRGPPPEVQALGVKDIQAASSVIWPQIADQFSGTLFLVDKTGSAVAEALSDVEKVGKLTSALRLSESDRRKAEDELKIRRLDQDSLKERVDGYIGLEVVSSAVESLGRALQDILNSGSEIREAETLNGRLRLTRRSVENLEGFEEAKSEVESLRTAHQNLVNLSRRIQELGVLRSRLVSARKSFESLRGFDSIDIPSSEKSLKIKKGLEICQELNVRLKRARPSADSMRKFSPPEFPIEDRAVSLRKEAQETSSLLSSRFRSKSSLEDAISESNRVSTELDLTLSEIHSLLGDRGICPICETVHTK